MTTAPLATPVAMYLADVELTRPLADLDGLETYAAVRAVARIRGVPVAEVRVPVRAGRVTSAALIDACVSQRATELTRHLLRCWLARAADADAPTWDTIAEGDVGALARVPDAPDPPLPSATVAVCTRDRPDDLARCLTALTALEYPQVDVLVVDNAPRTDATERLVRDRFGAVRHVLEPRPGLDWARNRAIREARGDVLAFTDDDVVPDPGWLRALGRVFGGSPAVMAVSGMIEPAELETQAQLDLETYCGFGHGWLRRWLYRPRRAGWPDYWHHGGGWLGTGANMAFRRTLFDTLGGFDPALDVGTETQGGGDIEMLFRVVQEGELLVYAPEALVRHRHRRGDDELRRQLTTWGSGYHAFVRRSRRAYPEERRAFDRLAWWWWREYILRTFVHGGRLQRGLIPGLRRFEVEGTLRGMRSYDRAERRVGDFLARYPDEPTALPQPSAPRGAAPDAGRSTAHVVAIDEPVTAPLELVGDPVSVRVTATVRGHPVADAMAVPERGRVSMAQLLDVLAAGLTHRVLADAPAERIDAVRRSLAAWLDAVQSRGDGRG